jgi:hypothetical protein
LCVNTLLYFRKEAIKYLILHLAWLPFMHLRRRPRPTTTTKKSELHVNLLLLDHQLSFSFYFLWYQELSCQYLDLHVVVGFFIISIAEISIVVRRWIRKDAEPEIVVVADEQDGEKTPASMVGGGRWRRRWPVMLEQQKSIRERVKYGIVVNKGERRKKSIIKLKREKLVH